MEKLKPIVIDTIDKYSVRFKELSRDIWAHPETNFEEFYSHELLCSFLEEFGFNVQKNYILPTAFRAEFSKRDNGPTVAVICEYDALPKIGHACGHNLIAETGVAAGIGVKAVLEANPIIGGKVIVLGTPAEEGGGGKIKLIEEGAFKDIDIAIMVHPCGKDYLYPQFVAILQLTIKYYGKASHASSSPWDGINALDAAVACYNNISLLRQQIKPTCRVHGIISNGGTIPNIIPEETELEYFIRAANSKDLETLKKQIENCCVAAAQATGCEVKLNFKTSEKYENLLTNSCLTTIYAKYAEILGIKFLDGRPDSMASTDMGNVSHVVPSIHPLYSIGTTAPNHSVAFVEAANSESAQLPTLIAAKSLALTALEVMLNPQLLTEIKKQFKNDLLIADSK